MTRLTFSNGAQVNVAAEKVDRLLRHGFTEVERKSAPAKKTAAKKATSSKTEK